MATRKNVSTLVVLLVIGIAFSNQGHSQGKPSSSISSVPRIWQDSKGREINATLEGFKDKDTLILRLENGRSLPYPIANLSSADQEFAKKAYEKQGESGNDAANIDWDNPKNSPDFVIRGVKRGNAPGYVFLKDGGWKYAAKCIEVRVQYRGKEKSSPAEVRAYFYNREGKLIDQFDKPPKRQGDDRKYIEAPTAYEKSKAIEHFFPLTPFLVDSNWATVLITFGSGDAYSARTMPGKSFQKLAFDEKEYLFPAWSPNENEGDTSDEGMSDVTLEIRRFGKKIHPMAMTFDGRYQDDKPCMTAEIRAKGTISPGQGNVKLYAFDKSGKLLASRDTPSSAHTKKSGEYTAIPKIADSSWYPVYFALDRDLKEEKPTYLILFQFNGKTTATIRSSVGATIQDLNFPEKDKIKP